MNNDGESNYYGVLCIRVQSEPLGGGVCPSTNLSLYMDLSIFVE